MLIKKVKNIFKKDEFTNQYLKQFSANFIIRILNIVFSIIYVPLVLGYLDTEKYGLWITLTTIVNWIRLFDVGIGIGLRNKLAEALALNDYTKAKTYVSTSYILIGSIFIGLMFLLLLLNPLFNWNSILNTSVIDGKELYSITNVVISFIILTFVLQTLNFVYEGHGNTAAGGWLQLISNIIALILIWFVTKTTTQGNLFLLALIFSAVPFIVYLIFTFYTFIKKYALLAPSYKYVDIKKSKDLIKLSLQFFAVKITATIIYSTTPFVITQLFSPNEVTQFSLASTIFNLPILLISLVTTPILPLVTKAYTLKDFSWLKSMLKKLNVASLLLIVLTILLVILSDFIYDLWIGDKASIPRHLTIAVALYTIINITVNPYATFINGIGKIKFLVILGPLGIILYLGGSLLFSFILNDVVAISFALSLASILGLFIIPYKVKKIINQ